MEIKTTAEIKTATNTYKSSRDWLATSIDSKVYTSVGIIHINGITEAIRKFELLERDLRIIYETQQRVDIKKLREFEHLESIWRVSKQPDIEKFLYKTAELLKDRERGHFSREFENSFQILVNANADLVKHLTNAKYILFFYKTMMKIVK